MRRRKKMSYIYDMVKQLFRFATSLTMYCYILITRMFVALVNKLLTTDMNLLCVAVTHSNMTYDNLQLWLRTNTFSAADICWSINRLRHNSDVYCLWHHHWMSDSRNRLRFLSFFFNWEVPHLPLLFGPTYISKQSRPRSDAIIRDVPSGSSLFVTHIATCRHIKR